MSQTALEFVNNLRNEQVSTGNFDKISSDLKYQWSTDGSSWTDIPSDFRISDLSPETEYFVKAIYRDAITSQISSISTYPVIQLSNNSFETYSIVRGEDGKVGRDYGAQYEWADWATLNAMTACHCSAAAYAHNSRSGTRPSSDLPFSENNTTSARIISLTYGYGGTYKAPKYYTHSQLYLGSYSESGDVRNYGKNYITHPTALKFWYKCITNVADKDKSQAVIKLYSDNTLLAEGEFLTGAKSEWALQTVMLNYIEDPELVKLQPNKISVIFKSGTKDPLALSDFKKMFGADNFITGNTNTTADAMWRGNELFIDGVELVYDK